MAGLNEPIEPTKMWDKDGFEIPPKFFRGPLPFDDIRAYQDPPGFREFIEAARAAYCETIRGDRNYEPCDCGQVHSTTEPLKFTSFEPDDVSEEQRRTVDEILRHANTTARPLHPPSNLHRTLRDILDGRVGTSSVDDRLTADRVRRYYRWGRPYLRPDDPRWTTSTGA